jgi:DNA-binding ferritin-like protein
MMSEQETLNEIVGMCFGLQMLTKLYHWNTTSYARHKASDEFGDGLSDLLDKFVEVYVGRYGVKPVVKKLKLEQSYITEDGIIGLFAGVREYLKTFETKFTDTDLLNIRDELLACVNKTLYLFNLK